MGANFGEERQFKLLSLAFISNSVLLHVINHGIINNSNWKRNIVFRHLQITKTTFKYVLGIKNPIVLLHEFDSIKYIKNTIYFM